jgi:glycosyltransferase involved in cell wall biosynthesis
LADSEATKADLKACWQVPASKVSVLYSGVHERFQPVANAELVTAVRQKYEIGNTPYILSVGTVQPRKNYQMLIRAFKPIADNFPHRLIISGGKGWLYQEMMDEVSRQGLDGRVHFAGFVEDSDLPALYSGADLFVFPSLYEGFGLPLLEAMGCGTAVISSNASSLPEVAGEAAVQLPPEDEAAWSQTMHHLLIDQYERERLITAGFSQINQFRWQKSAKQLVQIYQQLLPR